MRHHRAVRRLAALTVLFYSLAVLVNGTELGPSFAQSLTLGIPVPIPQGATLFAAFVALVVAGASRGLLRGQRPVYLVVVVVMGLSAVAHLLRGTENTSAVLALVVVCFLLVESEAFRARVEFRAVAVRLVALVVLAAASLGAALVASFVAAEARSRVSQPTLESLLEGDHLARLVKLIALIGLLLLATAVGWALTAPDERLPARSLDDFATARRLVAKYGDDSLSYFALRSDKCHLVVGNGLVTYAVVDGICLVAPDPLGPDADQAWQALRTFAGQQGWPIALVAASDTVAARLRENNMVVVYTGDEAIVDVRNFRLDGHDRKSLRQAVNRMRRHGYRTEVHNASDLSVADAQRIHAISDVTRRGEVERGFSMTLGRSIEADDESVVVLVKDAASTICAYCQFVPSSGPTSWSLDVMRRDGRDHPNGLMELALVDFFGWVDETDGAHVSLNFAPFRSVVDGTTSVPGLFGLDRWALRRLEGASQITSLYRFNAKFDPMWQPRYAVVESPEHLFPATLAWLRAEGFASPPLLASLAARLRLKPGSVRVTEVTPVSATSKELGQA